LAIQTFSVYTIYKIDVIEMDLRVHVIQGYLMLIVETAVKVTNGKQQLTAESCPLILK